MPYNKYIKIRNKSAGANSNAGIRSVDRYDDNDEKTLHFSDEERDRMDSESAQTSIENLDEYAENEAKTINPLSFQRLVSVINAESRDTFVKECIEAEKLYHSHKEEGLNPGQHAIEAYHIISSCKGVDLDPWMVHHAGSDLAKALAGDEFAAKICTHLNTGNYHNHIIINAYSNDGTHKFKDEFHLYKKIRTISDEIALRYGFDIIMEGKTDKKNWSEYLEGKPGWETLKSINGEVKKDIRDCIQKSGSYDDFQTLMESLGYELIKSGKRTTYIRDGISVSDYRLGSRYSRDGIEEEIEKKNTRFTQQNLARQTAAKSRMYTKTDPLDRISVPAYDEYGRRRPFLIRFLLLIKKYIEFLSDRYLDEMTQSMFPDNLRVQDAAKKMASIDEAIATIDKYHILTVNGLNEKAKNIGMNGKIAENQAAKLYDVAENMEDAVQLFQMEDYLKTVMDSIGLTDDQFFITPSKEKDVIAAYAALDPVTGDQKRRLWNALKGSGYRIRTGGFQTLTRTQADEILQFFRDPSGQKPDVLLSEQEYSKKKAAKYIQIKAKERWEKMHERYGNVPASTRQKMKLKELGFHDDVDRLKKDRAMHLLNVLAENPLKAMKPAALPPQELPSKWMISTLKDLVLLHPEDFKNIEPERLEREQADEVISYYLSKYVPEDVKQTQSKPKGKSEKINLDEYPDVIKRCIIEYRRLLNTKQKYGLSERGTAEFIERYKKSLDEADALSERAKELNHQYKELGQVSRTLKNCMSKSFVYGVLYGGPDRDMQEAMRRYDEDPVGRLDELSARIREAISQIASSSIHTREDFSSIRFEPLDRNLYDLLSELETICPEYFPDITEHPTRFFNDADALDVLRRIDHEHALDKLKKELLEAEKAEKKEPENNHKSSNLKSDTSASKEITPIDISESTQQNVKLKPENTTNSEEETENQQQPKRTFPFFHHR